MVERERVLEKEQRAIACSTAWARSRACCRLRPRRRACRRTRSLSISQFTSSRRASRRPSRSSSMPVFSLTHLSFGPITITRELSTQSYSRRTWLLKGLKVPMHDSDALRVWALEPLLSRVLCRPCRHHTSITALFVHSHLVENVILLALLN